MFDMIKPQILAALQSTEKTLRERSIALARQAEVIPGDDVDPNKQAQKNNMMLRSGIWWDLAEMLKGSIGQ